MELGTFLRKAAVALLLLCTASVLSAGDYSWTVGVMPADISALTSEADLLAAQQWEESLLRRIDKSHERILTQQERDYLARRYEQACRKDYYDGHHSDVTRLNEQLFTRGTPPVRPDAQVPDCRHDPSASVDISMVKLDEAVRFDQQTAAFLLMIEAGIDELIGLSVDRGYHGKYEMHVYRFYRGTEGETLYYGEYAVSELSDYSRLYGQLDQFLLRPEAEAHPVSPESRSAMIRAFPPGAVISGSGDVYHIAREGYSDSYLIARRDPAGMQELHLTPAWKADIYPIHRSADEFYRSLAGFMLSLPVGFLTYGIAQDNPDAMVLFYGSVGLSVTTAVKSLIDLFGYTNYAH